VDRLNAPVHDVTGVSVLAGPGDDEVYNETTTPVAKPINGGPGEDTCRAEVTRSCEVL
jgi:hypothetical protein